MGDVQLRNLSNGKMEKEHYSIEKRFKPGMKVKEAVKHTGKVDSDVAITHASSTNNVASTTPQELCKEATEMLREIEMRNTNVKIAFSAVFRRTDSHELNAKVSKLNDLWILALPLKGSDMSENNDILSTNVKVTVCI